MHIDVKISKQKYYSLCTNSEFSERNHENDTIYYSCKNQSYLGMNLTKKVNDFYNKNDKTLKIKN